MEKPSKSSKQAKKEPKGKADMIKKLIDQNNLQEALKHMEALKAAKDAAKAKKPSTEVTVEHIAQAFAKLLSEVKQKDAPTTSGSSASKQKAKQKVTVNEKQANVVQKQPQVKKEKKPVLNKEQIQKNEEQKALKKPKTQVVNKNTPNQPKPPTNKSEQPKKQKKQVTKPLKPATQLNLSNVPCPTAVVSGVPSVINVHINMPQTSEQSLSNLATAQLMPILGLPAPMEPPPPYSPIINEELQVLNTTKGNVQQQQQQKKKIRKRKSNQKKKNKQPSGDNQLELGINDDTQDEDELCVDRKEDCIFKKKPAGTQFKKPQRKRTPNENESDSDDDFVVLPASESNSDAISQEHMEKFLEDQRTKLFQKAATESTDEIEDLLSTKMKQILEMFK